MRKRLVTSAEELLLQNRSATNAEQVVSHEKEICYFWGKSYCYRTDLLQMLNKVFFMSNMLIAFAEGVTNAEQVVVHEQLISYFCITDLLLLLSRQLFLHFVNSNFLQESKQICSAKVTKFSAKVTVLQEESSLLAKVTSNWSVAHEEQLACCYFLPFQWCIGEEKNILQKKHVWKLTRKCVNMADECWSPHV